MQAVFLRCNTSIFCHHPGEHIWKEKIKFCYSFKSFLSLKVLAIGGFFAVGLGFFRKEDKQEMGISPATKLCSCWAVPPHCTKQEQGSPPSPPPCGSMMNYEVPRLQLKRQRPGKSCIPVNHEDKIGVQSFLLEGWESSCTSGLCTPTQDIWSPRLRQNGPTWSLTTPVIIAGFVPIHAAVTESRSMNTQQHHEWPSFPHGMAGEWTTGAMSFAQE